jgi:hypothetical protein
MGSVESRQAATEADKARDGALRQRAENVPPPTLEPIAFDCGLYWDAATHFYGLAAQAYAAGDFALGQMFLIMADQHRQLALLCDAAKDWNLPGRREDSRATPRTASDLPPLSRVQARREEVQALRDPEAPTLQMVPPKRAVSCIGFLDGVFEELEAAHQAYSSGDTAGGDFHMLLSDGYTALYEACASATRRTPQ